MMVGGIAVGVAGSRLLPPLGAMARGAAKSAVGDPFEKLENDHRLILSTLESMKQRDGDSRVKRTALFLLLQRKLAKHALAEQDVVYPLLIDEASRREAAKHLYDEHADEQLPKLRQVLTDSARRHCRRTSRSGRSVDAVEDESPKKAGVSHELGG